MLVSPLPRLVATTSKPRPSSLTSTLSWSPSARRRTTALEAWAYFWMFWRASRMQKYRAASVSWE
jgi:hypothetical protein